MSLLSRLTRKRPETAPLRWETIAAQDTPNHPGVVPELVDKTRDGVTITGVFSHQEIERGLAGLEGVPRLDRPFGWLLGMALGMTGPEEPDRSRYCDDAERANAALLQAFGFSPFERLIDVLAPMSGELEIGVPSEDGRPYNPGQVRWWEPGQGGLPAHVGNEFRRQLQDGAMRHLLTTTAVANHLSYFVVLQQAEQGGGLAVYDLVWDENEGRDDWDDCGRDDGWILSLPSTEIPLEPGDLVVFGGGWRWHRVVPPEGSQPRITYGGFAAPSIDGTELHFWA